METFFKAFSVKSVFRECIHGNRKNSIDGNRAGLQSADAGRTPKPEKMRRPRQQGNIHSILFTHQMLTYNLGGILSLGICSSQ